VRQLLAQGLLSVEGEYGTLVLTEDSAEVLGGRREVRMRRDPKKTSASRERKASKGGRVAPVELPEEAAAVFERLRVWRAATAKEQGVPAYVIFHDATLREVALTGPVSLAELGSITGVGENKLAKYGEQLLAVLRPADGPAAAEDAHPADGPNPVDGPDPADDAHPADGPDPVDDLGPTDDAKTAVELDPAEDTHPADGAASADDLDVPGNQ
jgi:ATP-dependent DNA helicase RecQ